MDFLNKITSDGNDADGKPTQSSDGTNYGELIQQGMSALGMNSSEPGAEGKTDTSQLIQQGMAALGLSQHQPSDAHHGMSTDTTTPEPSSAADTYADATGLSNPEDSSSHDDPSYAKPSESSEPSGEDSKPSEGYGTTVETGEESPYDKPAGASEEDAMYTKPTEAYGAPGEAAEESSYEKPSETYGNTDEQSSYNKPSEGYGSTDAGEDESAYKPSETYGTGDNVSAEYGSVNPSEQVGEGDYLNPDPAAQGVEQTLNYSDPTGISEDSDGYKPEDSGQGYGTAYGSDATAEQGGYNPPTHETGEEQGTGYGSTAYGEGENVGSAMTQGMAALGVGEATSDYEQAPQDMSAGYGETTGYGGSAPYGSTTYPGAGESAEYGGATSYGKTTAGGEGESLITNMGELGMDKPNMNPEY